MTEKLKNCPICNGKAILSQSGTAHYAECDNSDNSCNIRTKNYRTYQEAAQVWNTRAADENLIITGETSDGYHTFNELYHHRAILFSVICNNYPNKAWKSKLHHDGTMFDGMFIVGINTPEGQATYHYNINPYWNIFKVPEFKNAPNWDGHTPTQAIERIEKLILADENPPLTIEELKRMNGEPVWVVGKTSISSLEIQRYMIIDDVKDDYIFFQFYPYRFFYNSYGKTWLAYRRKPEDK